MAIKGQRGFAAMDPAKQRAIASKGGKASHEKGTAHEFTPAEAREAGRKGGRISHQRGTAHRFTSEEARAAGRKGGERSRGQRRNQGMSPPAPTPPLTEHQFTPPAIQSPMPSVTHETNVSAGEPSPNGNPPSEPNRRPENPGG